MRSTTLPFSPLFPAARAQYHSSRFPTASMLPPSPVSPQLYLCEATGTGIGDAGSRAPCRAQQPRQQAAQPLDAQPSVAGVGGWLGGSQKPPTEHVAAHRVNAAAKGHSDAHRQCPGGE